jgi:hypothetical protein
LESVGIGIGIGWNRLELELELVGIGRNWNRNWLELVGIGIGIGWNWSRIGWNRLKLVRIGKIIMDSVWTRYGLSMELVSKEHQLIGIGLEMTQIDRN